MLKKITYLLILCALSIGFISFRYKFYYSFQPPSNYSGTPDGSLCSDCHGNLNSGGGSVTVNGLPSSFQPGQTYPFSVTISHGTANRTRWGFEINARDVNNNGVGTFSSTNPNAATNGSPSEIAHFGAVVTAPTNSYTYTGLSWTAPANISDPNKTVAFYIAGNAANNSGDPTGDFIYSNTILFTLPITLKAINYKIIDDYKVLLDWKTATESNSKEFSVEKSDDGNRYYEVGRLMAAGNSTTEKAYSFVDDKPSLFNQPVFYRLKLTDLDGKFKYSKIIQVTLKGKAAYVYSLSPNPASDFITASITSDKTLRSEVQIVSVNGLVMSRQFVQLQKGKNTLKIPVSALSHGRYFLHFSIQDFTQSIAFVAL